jgi:hypothetical protein
VSKRALTATPVSKEDKKAKVREWSNIIGLRAAARKFGVNEDTACWWSHYEKWGLPKCYELSLAERKAFKAGQSSVRAIQDEILADQSAKTMLYASSAALKATFEAAGMTGPQLMDKNAAIAFEAHTRAADRTHGWTAMRQQAQTQVAVQVVMPTPEERAQRDEEHRKLDEIARLLREGQ